MRAKEDKKREWNRSMFVCLGEKRSLKMKRRQDIMIESEEHMRQNWVQTDMPRNRWVLKIRHTKEPGRQSRVRKVLNQRTMIRGQYSHIYGTDLFWQELTKTHNRR